MTGAAPGPPPPPAQLRLEFEGWCLLRIPTDPDPTDERRGISGYTFAFAGEADLDRQIYLQPPEHLVRSHSPDMGVEVTTAVRMKGPVQEPVSSLVGARVDLEDGPVLENRNWTLTLPGQEPICPFHLRIRTDTLDLYRSAPFYPDKPDTPVVEVPAELIAEYGAAGLMWEPETVGRATGIWDTVQVARDRLASLESDLAALPDGPATRNERACLQGRIAELKVALAPGPPDRRLMARFAVERFFFQMKGKDGAVAGRDVAAALGGTLNTVAPWTTAFWFGGWDPDLLAAWMQGYLMIPYATLSDADAGSAPSGPSQGA